MRRYAVSLLAALALGGLCAGLPAQPGDDPEADLADVAGKLAPEVGKRLVAKQGAGSFRVAVFPIGDADGKFTLAMHESSRVLQGELIYQLINQARGKFLVLDKAALSREFKEAQVDPARVQWGNQRQTAELLRKLNVDAGVFGTIDATKAPPANRPTARKANVALTVYYKDASVDQIAGQAPAGAIVPPTSNPSDRFKVEILARAGDRLVPLKLVTSNRKGSEFDKVVFAAVPRSVKLGGAGAEYRIRVTNNGRPPLSSLNPSDGERLFGVVVMVDGVNSIYQDTGAGKVGPVVVHPRNARKWILAGPGQRLVPDRDRREGYRLERVNGPGGSVLDVPGFQRDQQTAEAFTFAPARESVAEAAGITTDIGVISLHFFSQPLPRDPLQVVEGGTKAGRDVGNHVFRVNVKLDPNPIAVLRIFYRYEDEIPIPPSERVAADGPRRRG
jgi:hypothetical protein